MKKAKHLFALLVVLICLFPLTVPALAVNAGVINKVYIQLSAPPVILMDPGTIQATTSTAGCSLVSMVWYDTYSRPITAAFTSDRTTLVLTAAGYGGYLFADNTAAYINGSPVSCAVGSGGATVTIAADYMPAVWAPTVRKNPSDDVVDEGGTVSFVAAADYTDSDAWKVLDKDGRLWTLEELAMQYPDFNYHDTAGRLIMNNVPKELDGAQFCCTFDGPGGKIDTNWARLRVNYEVEETPPPTPSPTPKPTPKPTPLPSPTPKIAAHTHQFSSDWKYDASSHWHECGCGEKKESAPHELQWETVKEATRRAPGKEKGVCPVCGFEKEKELAYEGKRIEKPFFIILAIASPLLLAAILLIGGKIKRKKELERRRKEALRRRREKQRREWDKY